MLGRKFLNKNFPLVIISNPISIHVFDLDQTGDQLFFCQVIVIAEAFFNILRNKYPQLTENDLKMCSLIRLGYSNKEIATIRGIEPGSVKRSKTRMRKKIGLEKEANLTKLFTSIQPIINNKEE